MQKMKGKAGVLQQPDEAHVASCYVLKDSVFRFRSKSHSDHSAPWKGLLLDAAWQGS